MISEKNTSTNQRKITIIKSIMKKIERKYSLSEGVNAGQTERFDVDRKIAAKARVGKNY